MVRIFAEGIIWNKSKLRTLFWYWDTNFCRQKLVWSRCFYVFYKSKFAFLLNLLKQIWRKFWKTESCLGILKLLFCQWKSWVIHIFEPILRHHTKNKPWISRKNDKALKTMIEIQIVSWKTIEGNGTLRVRFRV